ncbi:DNA cytosine methyltransferase [Streptomyces albidoflavus]|uniref:DNA cytosine methyltransferase n=1 Tax=Streptomyces albidoflavus TaxID=1886 RepID=UPI00101E6D5B|nr:DNA cytosine methyltransferase [Streptomyces albidoflavus]RZE63913.1 DNA cytosine methyltransferase [Streptomyces albidoflavus]RZE77487.1 DNA cytosine methyltransferase [Streptomyces albidoflavus]
MNSPGALAHHLDGIRILDLFAGAGGLDVAAHFLGFRSLGIEWDRNACETRYAAGLPTIHADVSVMRQTRFHEIPESVDVLAGGPPCQSFSVAGTGAGRVALDTVKEFIHRLVSGEDEGEIDQELHALGDPRTALVLEPLRWLLKAIDTEGRDPYNVIVLEQVPTVLPLWEVYAEVLSSGEGRLGGIKYEAACWALKTEQFGVPQTRTRAVLVARRPGHGGITPLEPTHLPFDLYRRKRQATRTAMLPTDAPDAKKPWLSMAEALNAAANIQGSPVNVSRLSTDDEMKFFVVSNYGSGGDPKNRGRRLSSEPAFTVTGKVSRNKVYKSTAEYEADKWDRFTIPESGVLQTFPHNFPWSGNDQAQQVGNAVPPRLGMHVLSNALRGDAPSAAELAAATTWPTVPRSTTHELRSIGCGDRSQCPPTSHKVTPVRRTPAP